MKILHTADLHLKEHGDLRWQALEHVMDTARDRRTSLVVISGDLFDKRVGAARLKSPLRDLFRQHNIPVAILPGNHDADAFDEGDYYGDDVAVVDRSDHFFDFGATRIFGLPFERIEGDAVIEKLLWISENTRPEACNILLYHGELLDMVHARDGFGEEDETMYMPVRLPYFDGLGLDYVLAGHFHSGFEVRRYRDGYFVYPGSPVSITRKETGVRKACLIETGKPPQAVELSTPFFDEIIVKLNPFDGEDPVDVVRDRLRDRGENARILLHVSGFVDMESMGRSERELDEAIRALHTPDIERMEHRWEDVGVILRSDLYERCKKKIVQSDLSTEQTERVRQIIVESMMENPDAY